MRNNVFQIAVLAVIMIIYSFSRPGYDTLPPPFEPAFPQYPPFMEAGYDRSVDNFIRIYQERGVSWN